MAVTYIDYKDDKGFYIVEDAMELAFQYIYKELKKEEVYSFTNKEGLLQDAEYNVNGWCRGYLVLMWHEELEGLADEQEMIRLLENIVSQLQKKGEFISVEEIHSFPSEAEDWKSFWYTPFPTKNLLNIFDALIKMLKGEWESTNYDMKIDFNR